MGAAAASAIQTRRWATDAAALTLAALTLAACAGGPQPGSNISGQSSSRYTGYKVGKPYQVRGVWYYPKDQPHYDEIGIASWYGAQFHNQYTADGEMFDMRLPSAAHKTLPLPSLVEVTNLANGKKIVVRVNDRGPFVDGRVIDMSKAAAELLGFSAQGVTRVRVRYVGRAPDPGVVTPSYPATEPVQQVASARRPSAPAKATAPAAADPTASSSRLALAQSSAPTRSPSATASSSSRGTGTPNSSAPSASTPNASASNPSPPSAGAPNTNAPGVSLPDVDSLLADAGPAVAPATYELQAGTFATENAARSFASSLTGSGLPEVQPVQQESQTLYRVVVRGLANPTEAAAARSQAIALGARNPLIIGGS